MENKMDRKAKLVWTIATVVISICIEAYASTTESSYATTEANEDATTEATSTEKNRKVKQDQEFLNSFPQSALSLVGLGLFIMLSIAVAYGFERLYERLSIRDDSSDMSETTKSILKARVLGMVFGKKGVDISKLEGKEREKAIAKKFVQKWHYNMIMKKQRRKRESKENIHHKSPKRGSLFSSPKRVPSLNSSSIIQEPTIKEEDPPKSRPTSASKSKSNGETSKDINKDLVLPAVTKSSPQKTNANAPKPRKLVRSPTKGEFVLIDLQMAPEAVEPAAQVKQTKILIPNKDSQNDVTTIVGLADTSLDDEFAIDLNPMPTNRSTTSNSNLNKMKSGSKNDLASLGKDSEITSQKYVPSGNVTPKPSIVQTLKSSLRPLTAGKSRQIAPGGAKQTAPAGAKRGTNSTDNYKQQGTNVRSEVMKKLAGGGVTKR